MSSEYPPREMETAIQKIAGYAMAALLGFLAALISYLINPRFFFNDDEQNQYYAYFLDIGEHLQRGVWPAMSLSTFFGGNLIDDWQYAMWNPISLCSYVGMTQCHDLALAGFIFGSAYLSSLAVACYRLGRLFSISSPLCLVLAFGMTSNNFLLYVFGFTWMPWLINFHWFVWVWATFEAFRQAPGRWTLLGCIGTLFLAFTSSVPHTDVAMVFLILGYLIEIKLRTQTWSEPIRFLAGVCAAGLMSLPGLLPTYLSLAWCERPSGIFNNGLLDVTLGTALNLSSIFFLPRIHYYDLSYSGFPLSYLGWFVLPLLPLIRWEKVPSLFSRRYGYLLLLAASTLLLFGPETLGLLHFPFRFFVFVHLGLLLGFLLTISQPDIWILSRRRLVAVALIVLLSFTSAVSVHPILLSGHILSLCLVTILVTLAVILIRYKCKISLALYLLFSQIVVLALVHLVFPVNFGQSCPNLDTRHDPAAIPVSAKPFTGYDLYLGPILFDEHPEYYYAARGIYHQTYTFNGYTSVTHIHLGKILWPYNWMNVFNPDALRILASREPTTGRSWLELMRVNRLAVNPGYYHQFFHLDPARDLADWHQIEETPNAVILKPNQPNTEPTTLSYRSPGVSARTVGTYNGMLETMQVDAGAEGGRLVFARLWWPGYEALLNGKPVRTEPLNNLLVSIELPPHSSGNLVLQYVPPGFRLSLALAGLGLVLALVGVVIPLRRLEA